tara:strand:- start:5697 stop:6914 length:1218 start_codon:yes stop_codon:yes gene_type:complete
MYKNHPVVNKALKDLNKNIPDNLIGIRGKLYNIKNFNHPGGNTFLEINKGCDVTHLFETHHINIKLAEKYLDSLESVGNYEMMFNYDYTKYNIIREQVFNKFKNTKSRYMNKYNKCILSIYLFIGIVSNSYLLTFKTFSFNFILFTIFNSIINSVLGGFGHNGLHKLELSTLLLDFNGLSTSEWLLEHVSSHHMYPNTIYDHDSLSMMPFLNWIPTEEKSIFSSGGKHIIYLLAEIIVSIQGLLIHRFRMKFLTYSNLNISKTVKYSPFIFILRVLLHLYFQGFYFGSITLLLNLSFAGYYFSYLAHLNHGNSESKINENYNHRDFIEHQLNNTKDINIDINEFINYLFLNLRKQCMHHLFPTIDHCHSDKIYEILKKNDIKYKKDSLINLNNQINNVFKKYSNK